MNTHKRFSLPVVPISFILLLVVGAGIYWFFTKGDGDARLPKKPLNGDTLKVFRVPGGTLATSGLTKTETLSKSNKSDWWLGTTSSVMRVDATYRYEVELRSDWSFGLDEVRKVAFVVVPRFKPQIPVAIDTKMITAFFIMMSVLCIVDSRQPRVTDRQSALAPPRRLSRRGGFNPGGG